jgi:Spy/CpxP family protein refolding chaperone
MTMKTQLRFAAAYFTAAFLFLSLALMAQPRQHHQPRPQLLNAIEKMGPELELTAAQQSQLAELNADFKADLAKLKAQNAEEPSADRAAYRSLMQEYKTSINEVLTEEQQTKLQQYQQEQRGKYQQRGNKSDKKGMRSEMRSYRDENIAPVMLQQRAKLDAKLSTEDQAELAELRLKFKAAREEMRQLRQQEGPARSEAARQLREARQPDRDALKALVEKHDADIEKLMAEIEPQQEQWQKDMREISKKYRPGEGSKGGSAHRSGKKGKQWEGKKGEGKPQQGMKQGSASVRPAMAKGRFLLLEPNSADGAATAKTQVANLSAFPNPASSEVGIKYDLEKDADVRLEIRDRDGKLLRTINQPRLKAGAQMQMVDMSQLPDGVYYLAVISQNQQLVTKVVVSK